MEQRCRLTENNKRNVLSIEMDAFWSTVRTSRMNRIRKDTIRYQMKRQETVLEEMEYSTEVLLARKNWKQPRKNWMEGIQKALSSRELRDGDCVNQNLWRSNLYNVKGRSENDNIYRVINKNSFVKSFFSCYVGTNLNRGDW